MRIRRLPYFTYSVVLVTLLLFQLSETRAFIPPVVTTTTTALSASPLLLDNSQTTQIAFFPTKSWQHQSQFINAVSCSLMPTLKKEPGFVSCHVYASLGGTKVALLEQWESTDACRQSYSEQSLATAVRVSLKYVLQVDELLVDRHLYRVVGSTNPLVDLDDASIPLASFSVFPSTPENQSETADRVRRHLDDMPGGLRTATVLQSTDGTKVVTYGQWDKEKGFWSEKGYWDKTEAGSEHKLYHSVAAQNGIPK